ESARRSRSDFQRRAALPLRRDPMVRSPPQPAKKHHRDEGREGRQRQHQKNDDADAAEDRRKRVPEPELGDEDDQHEQNEKRHHELLTRVTAGGDPTRPAPAAINVGNVRWFRPAASMLRREPSRSGSPPDRRRRGSSAPPSR